MKYENMKKNEKKKKTRVGGEVRRKNWMDFLADPREWKKKI